MRRRQRRELEVNVRRQIWQFARRRGERAYSASGNISATHAAALTPAHRRHHTNTIASDDILAAQVGNAHSSARGNSAIAETGQIVTLTAHLLLQQIYGWSVKVFLFSLRRAERKAIQPSAPRSTTKCNPGSAKVIIWR